MDARKSPRKALGRHLRAFAGDRRGGIALWFGLAMPMLGFASLVAVDYSRASTAKHMLQESLDSANLIAARSTAITDDAIDTIGDAALGALLSGNTSISGLSPNQGGRIAGATFDVQGTAIVATASATVTPMVSFGFLGRNIAIHANGTVQRSINKLEIALVLDTTGSMQGSKITNLITAAKNFITTMEAAAARSTEVNPVKISVVPFSTTVRVQAPLSMANYNTGSFTMSGLPTWMDGRARSTPWNKDIFDIQNSNSARIDRFAKLKAIGRSWGGCVEAREPPYDIRETAPSSSDVDTLFTPWFWPDEPDTHSAYRNDYLDDDNSGNWSQRQGNPDKYDTTSFKASGTWIPSSAYGAAWEYGPNAACNMQRIMRLSTNFAALRTHIDGLVPSGETNVPLGLMWGWHTLTPNAPFSDGVAYGTPNTTKIIVLMTDGDNTMNDPGSNNSNDSWYHGYGYVWQGKVPGLQASASSGTRTDKLDERMVANGNGNQEDLCSNIKDRNILIYAVGVGVSNSSRTLLQNCATTVDNYYNVDSNGTSLNAAFDAIAGSIQNLRISH